MTLSMVLTYKEFTPKEIHRFQKMQTILQQPFYYSSSHLIFTVPHQFSIVLLSDSLKTEITL